MAVAIVRLEGEDIPLEHRQSGATAVFRARMMRAPYSISEMKLKRPGRPLS